MELALSGQATCIVTGDDLQLRCRVAYTVCQSLAVKSVLVNLNGLAFGDTCFPITRLYTQLTSVLHSQVGLARSFHILIPH